MRHFVNKAAPLGFDYVHHEPRKTVVLLYGTGILVDEGTFQLAQNDVEGREIDFLTVLGKSEPVRVYEIIAPAGCLLAAENELRGLFAEGLAAYRARN
jgi:adenylate cyclase